jgi:glycosyltransferase involved in cell wall biosynthesis
MSTGTDDLAAGGHDATAGDLEPLVSVIVRSTGRPELAEALASIAAQGYPNLEVVVVDAGVAPLAGVGERCGRFPLRVCAGNRPLARSRAANVGLDAARGDWLVFLDEDDLLDGDHVAGLVTAAQRSGCLAAYAGVRAVGANATELPLFDRPYGPAALRLGNFLPIHAVLFSRRLLAAGCRFDETLDAYEDWDFWLQLARHTSFERVGRITASYRVGGRSTVGLGADHEGRRRGRERIYEKWRLLWSGVELNEAFEQAAAETWQREAEIVRMHARLAGAAQERSEIEARLAGIARSRSFRLTAPLRLAGHFARRLLGRPTGAGLGAESGPAAAGAPAGPITVSQAPLISVIMPVYNALRANPAFLEEAMRSVFAQTYRHFELIVVDDGSTDGTGEACRRLAVEALGTPIRHLRKENGGQSSARNRGAAAASGSHLSFIDQDDVWFPDKLELVVPHLGEQVGTVYTDADTIDEHGRTGLRGIHRNHGCGSPHPKRDVEDILFKDIFVMPGLMTVRRQLFNAVGGFDEALSGYEDDDLFLRLFAGGSVVYLPASTLKWRMYLGNYSQSDRMIRSRLAYWRKLMREWAADGGDRHRAVGISVRFYCEFLRQAALQYRADDPLYRENLETARTLAPWVPRSRRWPFALAMALWARTARPWNVSIRLLEAAAREGGIHRR